MIEKLIIILRSTDSFGKRKKFLWKLIRPFIPFLIRWFLEGHPKLRGQLWYEERKLIYTIVRTYKPQYCFEIGTWKGGGSTYFISQALYENGSGIIHTVETNKEFYDETRNNYQIYLQNLTPFVEFHLGDYKEIYSKILSSIGRVDFLFLDGPEDAQETLNQYNFFFPYMRSGSTILVHDYFTEKARLVKSLVQNGDNWEIKKILTPPYSIGLAFALRK